MSIFSSSSHKRLSPECSVPPPPSLFISPFASMFSSPSSPVSFLSLHTHPSHSSRAYSYFTGANPRYLSSLFKDFNVFVLSLSPCLPHTDTFALPKRIVYLQLVCTFGCELWNYSLLARFEFLSPRRSQWVHLQRHSGTPASPETVALHVAVLLIAAEDLHFTTPPSVETHTHTCIFSRHWF